MARERNWRDSRWLNWRLARRFCIRLMPGLWFPAIYIRPSRQYAALVLPFFGVTFDWAKQ